jgi:hypothetical protein
MPSAQGYFYIFIFDKTIELLHYPCHLKFLTLALGTWL